MYIASQDCTAMSQYPSSRTITVGWEGYKLGKIEANFPEIKKKVETSRRKFVSFVHE
jgi:hypothetical protein